MILKFLTANFNIWITCGPFAVASFSVDANLCFPVPSLCGYLFLLLYTGHGNDAFFPRTHFPTLGSLRPCWHLPGSEGSLDTVFGEPNLCPLLWDLLQILGTLQPPGLSSDSSNHSECRYFPLEKKTEDCCHPAEHPSFKGHNPSQGAGSRLLSFSKHYHIHLEPVTCHSGSVNAHEVSVYFWYVNI